MTDPRHDEEREFRECRSCGAFPCVDGTDYCWQHQRSGSDAVGEPPNIVPGQRYAWSLPDAVAGRPCPECGGEGQLHVAGPTPATCPRCDGSGVVEDRPAGTYATSKNPDGSVTHWTPTQAVVSGSGRVQSPGQGEDLRPPQTYWEMRAARAEAEVTQLRARCDELTEALQTIAARTTERVGTDLSGSPVYAEPWQTTVARAVLADEH